MPIVKLSSGLEFESNSKLSILDAATKSNITLPYGCKNGRCSTCRCKVVSGMTSALQPETGLSEQEKKEGWILSCVRTAETAVYLEVDDLGGIVLPPIRTLPCRVSHLERLAPDIIQVNLRLPPTAELSFLPGQYIDVIGPNSLRRSYSPANSSLGGKVLELHIRALKGGAMSEYWFKQAQPNDLLRLKGPLGTFFLRDTAGIDLIFLATGTGIAPVKAMLESLNQLRLNQRPKSVTVLWGGRHNEDFYLNVNDIRDELTYIPVQSHPAVDWTGEKGYIQDVLLTSKKDLTNAAVYACGSTVMIQSAKERLIASGLPAKHFYSDAFVSSGCN